MAEREQVHRIGADKATDARDKTIVDTQAMIARRAQLGTLLIVMSFLGLVAFAVARGQELTGATAALAALATIIYAVNGGRFRRTHGAADAETLPAEVDRESGQ